MRGRWEKTQAVVSEVWVAVRAPLQVQDFV